MIPKVRKAVFPAAGLGTRFLPATKAQPKEMLPLVDKPLIQYGVEEAIHSGVQNIIIVTGRGKTAIEDHFDVSFELENLLESRNKNFGWPVLDRLFGTFYLPSDRRPSVYGIDHPTPTGYFGQLADPLRPDWPQMRQHHPADG